ncbi:MAG: hypothetical protein F6J98_32995 [Moorea sp. SIO4G2]|nr:hypothetical protein [Moorena sp. SIO4G2]
MIILDYFSTEIDCYHCLDAVAHGQGCCVSHLHAPCKPRGNPLFPVPYSLFPIP